MTDGRGRLVAATMDLPVAAGAGGLARPGGVPPPDAGFAVRAWTLLRPRLRHILVVAAVAAVLDFLRGWPAIDGPPLVATLFAFNVAVFSTVAATLIVVAVSCAQVARLPLGRRGVLMVAAAWAGVGAALGARVVNLPYRIVASVFLESQDKALHPLLGASPDVLMYLGWEFAAIGTAVALFYAVREREADLAAQAREAELAGLRVQRTMMESRLAVLRARVEPEFLFGALAEVRTLFGRDPAAADETIDALIAYLRAALPTMRGEAPTVGRELDLARAYVAVLQVPRGAALAVDARAAPDVRAAALPPMVLLPLVQAAFAAGDADLRRRFLIEAVETADGVRVRVEVHGGVRPDAWRGDGPETTSRTLKAFYGAGARLEFATEGAAHRADIHLPREEPALAAAADGVPPTAPSPS